MSTTRTRKPLVTAIAGLALTAGLGLGGAGVADAAPPNPHLTCITDITGETRFTVDSKLILPTPVSKPGHVVCLQQGQSELINIGADHAAGRWGTANLLVKATSKGVTANLQTMIYAGSGLPTWSNHQQTVAVGQQVEPTSVAGDGKGDFEYARTKFTVTSLS